MYDHQQNTEGFLACERSIGMFLAGEQSEGTVLKWRVGIFSPIDSPVPALHALACRMSHTPLVFFLSLETPMTLELLLANKGALFTVNALQCYLLDA